MIAVTALLLISSVDAEASARATTVPAVPKPGPEGARRATAERPLHELFTPEDYPAAPLWQAVEGTVGFRLEIDSLGNISSCSIIATSGNSELDRATCEIVRERARFHPAVDGEGRPLPDTVTSRVMWRVAHSPFWTFAPEHVVTKITWSAPDPVCTVTVNGEPMGRLSAADCLADCGGAALAVRDGRGEFEITLVSALIPAGHESDSPDEADHGERVWTEETELLVAPDGRVLECHTTRLERSDSLPYEAGPGRCEVYAEADARFEPAAGSDAPRRARTFSAVYLKRRSGE